jgi:F420-non-reducing hydrogenase large subunit
MDLSNGERFMKRNIVIDPVTRIEGHAKVLLVVGDDNRLSSAGLVVNEIRGFEKILVGMEADRMPVITNRICGVCPSAHHLAASKALDNIAGVDPPPAAKLLRELLYMGHFIHSHALSLFMLQGPDLVFGMDGDPAIRNVVGIAEHEPEVAKNALRLRSLGQKINELIGGRGVHPVNSVAGGIVFRLDSERKTRLKNWIDESLHLVQLLAPFAISLLEKQLNENPALRKNFMVPSWNMGLTKDNRIQLYDGNIRVIDSHGKTAIEFEPQQYRDYLTENTLKWSYMKYSFINIDNKNNMYRVGPMARLSVGEGYGTPMADKMLAEFREGFGRICHNVVLQTYARVVELVYACERSKQIISNSEIEGQARVPAKLASGRGVGVVEAPRGTLFHEYEVNEDGFVTAANLIIATQQNYSSINKSIKAAAETFVIGKDEDRMLNAIEFTIRCYDPCLSCATHAVGAMPMEIIVEKHGEIIKRYQRG